MRTQSTPVPVPKPRIDSGLQDLVRTQELAAQGADDARDVIRRAHDGLTRLRLLHRLAMTIGTVRDADRCRGKGRCERRESSSGRSASTRVARLEDFAAAVKREEVGRMAIRSAQFRAGRRGSRLANGLYGQSSIARYGRRSRLPTE